MLFYIVGSAVQNDMFCNLALLSAVISRGDSVKDKLLVENIFSVQICELSALTSAA